jgi:hypothetical protein
MTSSSASNIFSRLVITYTVGVALIFNMAGLSVAIASDVDSTNNQTGPNSSNDNSVSESNKTSVSVKNDTNINNQYTLKLNTGENTAKNNTNLNGTSTGNIGFTVNTTNSANNGGPQLAGLSNDTTHISSTNSNTGPDSRNNNSVSQSNSIKYTEKNTSNVLNTLIVHANTGKDNVSNNTNAGGFHTGNIFVNIDVKNDTNNHINNPKPGMGGGNPNIPPTNSTTTPKPTDASKSPITLMPIGGKGGGGFVPAGGDSLPYVVGLMMILLVGTVWTKKSALASD